MRVLEILKRVGKLFAINIFDITSKVNLYLSSGESLPEALSVEDENECINQLSGEFGDLARQKLIEHNLRLVVYIARKFENTSCDVEDLISIGSIGLIKAINSYRADKMLASV